MKCKQCGINEVEGKQVYCSDRCRKAFARTRPPAHRTYEAKVGHVCPDKSKTDKQVGQRAKDAKTLQLLGTGEGVVNFGKSDCQCKHCQSNRANNGRLVINHGPYKPVGQLADHEVNRVSLPGDPDYVGVATKERVEVNQ